MIIDCATCTMRDSEVCNDCIVTFLLDRPDGAVVFDVEEARALRTLQAGGLAAENRHRSLAPEERTWPGCEAS